MTNQLPQDQYVRVGDIRTRYWAVGDGKSAVILLHGLGRYIEHWEDNIEALAQNRRVYALDLVGAGCSDKPHVIYSIPYLTEFLHKFMNVLGIERATFIGASLGGAIAMQFAIQFPVQVEKLVLSGSAGLGKEVSVYLRVYSLPIIGEVFGGPSRKGSAELMCQIFYDKDLITNRLIDIDYEMSSLPGAQYSTLSALRSYVNIWGARNDAYRPILDHLEEIEAPTLLIWGAQDQILPLAHAQRAIKKLPNARLHIFETCGHAPNIECAEKFNAVVNEFLSNG